jgi:hypothetical protein
LHPPELFRSGAAIVIPNQRSSRRMNRAFTIYSMQRGTIYRKNSSVIIRFLASKSLFLIWLGVPGLKRRTTIAILVLIAAGVAMISCGAGAYSPSSSSTHSSGLLFRAFVSNPLFQSGSVGLPVINIVNAADDRLSPSTISLLATGLQPGLMAVSPSLKYTMVFNASNNNITIINNGTEQVATIANGTSSLPSVQLLGATASIFFGTSEAFGYAAVPNASITGQSPGAVEAFSIGSGAITAIIPVPAAQYIVQSSDGNHLLVFSNSSNNVTVIDTTLIGTASNPVSVVTGFDRPVWGIFSSNSAAYILNCGPECGGTSAGVSILTLGSSTAGATTPVKGGATIGLIANGTLYTAGSPPGTACTSGISGSNCGILSLLNLASMTVVGSETITNGYHDRIQLSADGQVFVGARSCDSACLSIFNPISSTIVVPVSGGDVTGIQPISGRTIVYVCQGGAFHVYDTTTDQLLVLTIPLDIVGQSMDVKLVDPPVSNVNNPVQ